MRQLPYRVQPLADRDLDDHVHYLRDRDPDVALRFIDAVFDAFETLSQNPEIGAARRFDSPALSGLRMWPVPRFEHWLIFYIPTDTAVQIVRVLHGARDLPTILNQ